MYYLRIYLSRRPLESFSASHSCPYFMQNSLERTGEAQLSPWGNRLRFSPESGGSGRVSSRGDVKEVYGLTLAWFARCFGAGRPEAGARSALRRKGRRGLNCTHARRVRCARQGTEVVGRLWGGHRSTSRGSGLGAPAAEPGAGSGALAQGGARRP
jgi:hypothetical protein